MINKLLIEQFTLLINQIKYNLSNTNDKKEINKIKFKIRHYEKIISIIKIYPTKIKNGSELKEIRGIGKGTIDRINEIIKNKILSDIDHSKITKISEKNNIINELSEVINIGSKVAKQLYDKHNIKSVKELKDKVKKNIIQVNDKIKMGLKYHGKIKLNIPRSVMDKYNKKLSKFAKSIDKNIVFIVAGSYRRGKKTSNDIDILLSHSQIKTDNEYKKININYLTEYINILKKNKIIVDDLTDIDNGTKYMGFCKLPNKKIIRIDIRFVPFNSYYSALLYFTGSYELNTQMRQIAKSLNYKLNEYGLYKISKDGIVSKRMLKIKSEENIFKRLKMEYLNPNQRG